MFRNTNTTWGVIAMMLHWIMAILILYLLCFGLYMTHILTDPFEKFTPYQMHKSWGVVAFTLVSLRILWRIASPRPDLPNTDSPYEHIAVKITHSILYLLMLLVPLSGWLMSSASTIQDFLGIDNMVFNLFPLPDPFNPGSQKLEDIFSLMHSITTKILIGFILLHIVGVIYHTFIRKDYVLKNMLPFRTKKGDQ